MPLILPILRAFWVFSNVFESFKTLKMPPPSSRNGGHPTVRAMSQRKRNMKGCMTVWLVWCCFATYERTLDGIIGIFVPFYSEIKSLVILFFLLTRARGAEPIYLHILRPVVKPYVATLDVLLELTHTAGDFLLLLASIPMDFVMSFYRPIESLPADAQHYMGNDEVSYPSAASAKPSERNASKNEIYNRDPPDQATETVHGAVRARRRPLESAHTRTSSTRQQAPSTRSSGLKQASSSNGPVGATNSKHQVWVPPQAAYEESGISRLPTPPREHPALATEQNVRNSGEDWRKYEPFPSAYPATPLVTTSNLPSDRPAREGMAAISEERRLDEPGDWRSYEAFPSAYPATPLNKPARLPQAGHLPPQDTLDGVPEENSDAEMPYSREHGQQDFQGSLERSREFPDSADYSSGDHDTLGDGSAHGTDDEEQGMDTDGSYEDEEEDDYEDEDDFDITLRTPSRITRTENISKASSVLTDASTGLSTTDNGSPFRTRTNSEASTLLNGSDSSSVAGHKRPHPVLGEGARPRPATVRKVVRVPKKPVAKQGAPARTSTSRTQARTAVPSRPPAKTPGESSTTLGGSESDAGASDSAASGAAKKRRVAPTSTRGVRQARPGVSTRSSNGRTTRGPSVKTPAITSTDNGTASNTGTIRANTKNARVPIAQMSTRVSKRQQGRAVSESSVGEPLSTRGSRAATSEEQSKD